MASMSIASAIAAAPLRGSFQPRLRAASASPSAAPARLSLAAPRGRALVVRAAESDGEAAPAAPVAYKPTKFSDVKDLSIEQIDAEVEKCKMELFYLRNRQVTRQEVKTSNFGVLKKKVAQLLTAKRMKFAEMNKRDFRRMQRKEMLEAGQLVK